MCVSERKRTSKGPYHLLTEYIFRLTITCSQFGLVARNQLLRAIFGVPPCSLGSLACGTPKCRNYPHQYKICLFIRPSIHSGCIMMYNTSVFPIMINTLVHDEVQSINTSFRQHHVSATFNKSMCQTSLQNN